MRLNTSRLRLVACLGLLALLAWSSAGFAQPGTDDARARRGSSIGPTIRPDIFDLLRRTPAPADRMAVIEQGRAPSSAYAFEIQKAAKGDVQLNVAERGDLDPAQKTDVICKVRCHERGKSTAGTILWVIDNATLVKKGDVVVKLDESPLRERLAEQQIAVMEKKSLVTQAAQEFEGGKAEAQRQLKATATELKLAEAGLKAHAATAELEKRKSDVKIEQAKLLIDLAKTKGGMAVEIRIAETHLQLAELDAKRLDADLGLAQLRQEAQVQHAQDAVALAKTKIEHSLAQLQAKRGSAEAVLNLEEAKLGETREDLGNCQLRSPVDGIVLYYEPVRRGPGTAAPLAAGEPVREAQRLLSVWKPGPMLVRMKVDESLVGRLQAGQRALVTIPAVKQTLAGKVQSIGSIAAMDGFGPSVDARVYPVVIAITEGSEMLRPTMPAQVSILLDEQKNVLRVPLHAVTQKDGVPYCFVKKDDGIHERKVTTGVTGSAFVEIKGGVESGEEVVVSIPRTLPTGFPGTNFPGGRGPGPGDR